MKLLIKFTGIFLVTMLIGISGMAETAQGKAKMTARTLPKSIRGTWWHYDGKGSYGRIRITAKKIIAHERLNSFVETVHSRRSDASVSEGIHPGWVFIPDQVVGWTHTYGWNQGSGAGNYYKVVHKMYHGRKIRVLKQGSGATMHVDEHDYTSQKLAKHFQRRSERY